MDPAPARDGARPFLLVGLTGGIASGKSSVSRQLVELGCRLVDADLLAREVVAPREPAWRAIVETFGPDVAGPDGQLDRKRLGALVFADPARRKALEGITHPAIAARRQAILDAWAAEGFDGLVVLDIPLLIEVGAAGEVDRVVVVYAEAEAQLGRLMARDGFARAEAERRDLEPDASRGEGAACRLRHRQLRRARRDAGAGPRRPRRPPRRAPRPARRRPIGVVTGRGTGSEPRRTSPRRRALGQHFLVDPGVAARIVEAVGATPSDVVCEIGAGPGALTWALAARAGRLIALEIDPVLQARLAEAAHERSEGARVDVRLADARSFAYEELRALRPAPAGRVLVVGNLPYSASKPILARLFAARAALDAAVLMLQREVAERLTAQPGGREYGALSIFWQQWTEMTSLEVVPPGAFRPPPAVESAVIRIGFRAAPRVMVGDEPLFQNVVRAAFGQRRKMLGNALRGGGLGAPERLAAALAEAAIDPARRAETLSLAEVVRLTEALGRQSAR